MIDYLLPDTLCYQVLNAYEFERHAGCKTKHPNNHIYFENGKTIYQIVQELRSTPESLLFDAIQTVFGAPINQKAFRNWKGKKFPLLFALHTNTFTPAWERFYCLGFVWYVTYPIFLTLANFLQNHIKQQHVSFNAFMERKNLSYKSQAFVKT